MDMSSVVQAISNLGFPVACVVAMFFMWQKEVESHKSEMKEMQASVEEQNRTMVEALNNNTQILNRILAKLGE